MSTSPPADHISAALFGKTQRALLGLFFTRSDQSFYLRQIVRTLGIGQGAGQRELARMAEAGLLTRSRRGNQVWYQANRESPVFSELKSLTMKTAGVGDSLREALTELADRVTVAFVHGSMARGTEKAASDVDVLIVGDVSFGEVTATLQGAQERIGREVNPTVYSQQEFRRKLRGGHHFLRAATGAPKLFLIGGERELKRLGA